MQRPWGINNKLGDSKKEKRGRNCKKVDMAGTEYDRMSQELVGDVGQNRLIEGLVDHVKSFYFILCAIRDVKQ